MAREDKQCKRGFMAQGCSFLGAHGTKSHGIGTMLMRSSGLSFLQNYDASGSLGRPLTCGDWKDAWRSLSVFCKSFCSDWKRFVWV